MITTTAEVKVSETCDCLWGANECPAKASWLVTHNSSNMYMIACDVHKEQFEELEPNAPVVYHAYSLELNKELAKKAEETSLLNLQN